MTFKKILSGIITGLIGGLIMAAVMMVVFWLFLDKNPLYPVQVIGSTIYGEPALVGFHLGAFLGGLVLHMIGPSLFWGVVFGILAGAISMESATKALFWGILIGAFSMIDAYVFVPMLMIKLHGVDIWNREVPMFWDWAAHLVYGASFVFYPAIYRKLNPLNRA